MAKTLIVTPTEPALGQVGKYRLLKELGNRGSVYEAEDGDSGRRVAVKMLPRGDGPAGDAERLTGLRHDHLVSVLEAGEWEGRAFVVMEILDGEPLRDRLKREHSLPWKETARLAREAAGGLAALHARGVIHRDVCPANLWLEPTGRLKLLGLGGQAPGDDQALLDRLAGPGTPGYLSPEQASGEPLTPASDLFGLGCILYQMATGEPPFRGENSAALVRAVVFSDPAPAREINPDVPAELNDLVMRLLSKLPGGRPASAREVEEQLSKWAEPAPRFTSPTPPSPMVYPASKRILETIGATRSLPEPAAESAPKGIVIISPEPPRKRRWLPDLVAALLLAAAATGLYFWWQTSKEPAPPAAATEKK